MAIRLEAIATNQGPPGSPEGYPDLFLVFVVFFSQLGCRVWELGDIWGWLSSS